MLDPIADLKLNQLDIVDMVRERQALLQVRFWKVCQIKPPFFVLLDVESRMNERCAESLHTQ